jgi:hypothetical protein
MNKKQQGGKVMLIGGSLILVGLVIAVIIGVFFFKKPTPPVQEEEPKVTYESKETKDLVTTYSSSDTVEVNKDYSKLGVSATLSNEEYRNKVQQVSTVVANGFKEVDQVDKDAVFELLNEALSQLTIDEGFGSASPALSQFTIMLNNYFGGSQGNPMISLNVLLTHIKSKVNTVNLSKTSTQGKIAIEFVIEDYDGNQLGYVTGYFGDYTKRFEITSASPLGYGQDYLNKTVPKNLPKSQGLE